MVVCLLFLNDWFKLLLIYLIYRALREKLDRAFSEKGGSELASNSSLVLSNREMRLLK